MRRGSRLLLWLCGLCAGAPPLWAQGALDVLRATELSGFERALQPRHFEFPADHGPHPGFRHEWWYVTGNLESDRGERLGFELTFFRVALAPPAKTQPAGDSAWRTTQLYSAHFALTDPARRHFEFAQRSARAALGLAGAEADPFAVWLGDWRLDADANGRWQLSAHANGYQLSLDAEPLGPPVANGEQGLSRKSAGAASYYYSIPRMAVRGRLVRAGSSSTVTGLAWLDREWGSGALSAQQQGWDWFALQLDDGSTLMFYGLRKSDGSRDTHSAGTWVDSSGQQLALSDQDVELAITDHWRSPSGVSYPAAWQLRVPRLQLVAAVRPILAAQELLTQPRYWEGAVDVQAQRGGRAVAGRGYVELVGYER